MATLTIPTRNLVGMLADLIRTASDDPETPSLCAVLLHTDHGEWTVRESDPEDRSEPLIDVIPSSLLIGSSTDRHALGQAHEPCEGSWHRPVLVSTVDAKALVAAFKPLIGSLGKEDTHRVQLVLEADTVTATEDPTQVPAGLTMSFGVHDTTDYPNITALAEPNSTPPGDKDGVPIAPSSGTGLDPKRLAAFVAIAKRRKEPLAMYRYHQHRKVVIEIGTAYRGVLMPWRLDEDNGQQNGPQVRVFALDLPGHHVTSTDPDTLLDAESGSAPTP